MSNNGGKTGWPPGLLQDDSKGLSRWLSNKPDARRIVRDSAEDAMLLAAPATSGRPVDHIAGDGKKVATAVTCDGCGGIYWEAVSCDCSVTPTTFSLVNVSPVVKPASGGEGE